MLDYYFMDTRKGYVTFFNAMLKYYLVEAEQNDIGCDNIDWTNLF